MVAVKKYFRKRYGKGSKKYAKKWGRISRAYHTKKFMAPHYFKRTVDNSITVYNSPDLVHKTNYGNSAFKLSILPAYTEITALFDQYRITGVKMTFIYAQNSANVTDVNATYGSVLPIIGIVNDYDDNNALTGISEYEQYSTYKERRLDKPFSVFFRPKLATAVYSNAAFSGYAQDTSRLWVDAGSPSAEYYGCKWFIDPILYTGNNAIAIGKLRVKCDIYFQARDMR